MSVPSPEETSAKRQMSTSAEEVSSATSTTSSEDYPSSKDEKITIVVKESAQSDSDVEPATQTPAWRPRKQEYAVMVTIALISLMVALDATILVPVLPTLATDLHGTASDAFWAGTSYLLTCAVFQPFISALSDLFGRQQSLLASILLFTVGTIICSVSHDFVSLLAGRSVQGIGGGGIITMGQVIFADIIPLRQRPKYFTIVLAAWALGTVLGPFIGGLLVQHTTWRWVFYINLPFCLIGFITVPLFIKLRTKESMSLKEKLLRVDWFGGIFFIASSTAFLVGLSFGGTQYPWRSYQTLLPLLLGLAGIMSSLLYEYHLAGPNAFFRLSLYYSPSAVAAYSCALMQGLLLFCALYYIPFYLMSIPLQFPTKAGVSLFPISCFLVPGSAIISALITRLGRFRWALWLGWTITTLGSGLLILLNQHTKPAVWTGAFVVFGLGNGIVLTSVNFGIQAIARTEDCGRAASMYAFMRTLGMTIGVAIGGTVFQNLMSRKLTSLSLNTAIATDAEGFIAMLRQMNARGDIAQLHAVAETYVAGFRGVWILMTGIAAVGLVASLFIKKHRMDDILMSKFELNN